MPEYIIIPNLNPLVDVDFPNRLESGYFRSDMLVVPLLIPTDENEIFCYKEVNGYGLCVSLSVLNNYLQAEIVRNFSEDSKQMNSSFLRCVQAGARHFNELEPHKIVKKEYSSWHKFLKRAEEPDTFYYPHISWGRDGIRRVLRSKDFAIKDLKNNRFLQEVNCVLEREFVGFGCGYESFKAFVGDVEIYEKKFKLY